MMAKKWIVGILVVFGYAHCVNAQPPAVGKLSVNVVNVFDGLPLVLHDKLYRQPAGDSIFIIAYKYYLSNVKLLTMDGKEFEEPESYRLVNEARSSSKKFDIQLPAGKYEAIKFMIGVDSLHNVSGAQTDALDPVNAMFWDWHTGYIMAKLEGKRNDVEQTEFSFHIGGYAGRNNTTRWVTLKFAKPIAIQASGSAAVNLVSDVAEWFRTPNKIDIDKIPVIATEGTAATKIADNYADMFSLDYVE